VFEQNKKNTVKKRQVQCAETEMLFYSMTKMQRFDAKVKNELAQ
jgi:hypothetical protein